VRHERCIVPESMKVSATIKKVLPRTVSLWLSACSFFAYPVPVVVGPPGGGDPSTTVGATVRCSMSSWPIALDVVGTGSMVAVGALGLATVGVVSSVSGEPVDFDAASVVAVFSPAGLYLASAIYGGMRSSQCRRALVAAARAKLRNQPLRFEGAIYEQPPGPAGPPGPPPPGPPQSVAPPPLPPR
jgi:hypothetical protein